MKNGIDALLTMRAATHGDYADKAQFIQAIKNSMRACPKWGRLCPDQAESLDMIATKLGRILYGDPNHRDSWTDIGGYARLIERRLK